MTVLHIFTCQTHSYMLVQYKLHQYNQHMLIQNKLLITYIIKATHRNIILMSIGHQCISEHILSMSQAQSQVHNLRFIKHKYDCSICLQYNCWNVFDAFMIAENTCCDATVHGATRLQTQLLAMYIMSNNVNLTLNDVRLMSSCC